MSNQQPPYNPYMFPFPYPYPPPPFMNPLLQSQARNQLPLQKGQQIPSMPPFHMPPFGFPPYPMMFPPPPHPYFPYFEPKAPSKESEMINENEVSINSSLIIHENRKINKGDPFSISKKQSDIIVLSDDESKHKAMKKRKLYQKKQILGEEQQEINKDCQTKLRRTKRKIPSFANLNTTAVNSSFPEKRKEINNNQKKKKIEKLEEKELKNQQSYRVQIQYQGTGRSSRTRFLTAKDGKGKIMIGQEFQADMPQFISRNQILTAWKDDLKKCLISRFIK